MTLFGKNVGYINYVVLLCVITGLLILYFDVNGYKLSGMKKERKAAKFLGIFNVSIGTLIWIATLLIE
jgi:O-antigen/teichoic acid export membrane protein